MYNERPYNKALSDLEAPRGTFRRREERRGAGSYILARGFVIFGVQQVTIETQQLPLRRELAYI